MKRRMTFRSKTLAAALSLLISVAANADAPQPRDFAEGIALTTGSQPLQEITVPDKVYATVTQWTLADIRVFNAAGGSVPYAFCSEATSSTLKESIEIPVYGLDARGSSATSNRNITLHTADGTSLTIQSEGTEVKNPLRANASYVIDAHNIEQDIDGLWLDWSLPSGASETSVSVLSSDDLSHWQTLVSNAKLLRATATDHTTLEQSSITLPRDRYRYLRVEPAGDTLLVRAAKLEYHLNAQPQSPIWYSAGPPHGGEDPHELRYENSRRAPVTSLRITPHIENSSMHVSVQSRDRPEHAWQTQWSGEVFDIHYNDQDRRNDVVMIGATTAPEWRLVFPESDEPPASAPSFELGYLPTKLRFLTQGSGPFMLAYGNAKLTTPSALPCDNLLSAVSSTDKQGLIGTPTIGATQLLGGKDALTIKKPVPFRTILLWAILLVGVGAIVKISLSLLKNSKRHEQE